MYFRENDEVVTEKEDFQLNDEVGGNTHVTIGKIILSALLVLLFIVPMCIPAYIQLLREKKISVLGISIGKAIILLILLLFVFYS